MRQSQINLDDLDTTIAKLERIKKLLEDIARLQQDVAELPSYPVQPAPTPYYPPQPLTPVDDPPWQKWKIYC